MRVRPALIAILFVACNGSTPKPPPPTGGDDVDAGDSPMASPDAGAPAADSAAPAADGAVVMADAESPAVDSASLVTVDAPVVVPPAGPGPDTTVMAFSGTEVSFQPTMGNNKRIVDVPVHFPAAGLLYKSVTMKLALRCPPAGCDFWDRRGFIGVVRKVGGKDAVTELLRFVTPFRLGASWTLDVTSLRPLLSGDVTLRVFIDTWVGPGNAQGAGWLVDASFDLVGGMPDRVPIAVIPLWDELQYDYGDPAKPVAAAVPPRSVTIPAGAGAVELRSFITGHGQGNLGNCSEFCQRTHAFTVGGTRTPHLVWRNDCATTAVPKQPGTYTVSRSGWCPGASVNPWVLDATAMAPAGKAVTVSYDVQAYENTCRPDAPVCMGCALGTGCAYDNGNHTSPFFELSAALIVYAK